VYVWNDILEMKEKSRCYWMNEGMNGNRRMMLVWFGSSIGSSFDVEIRHGPYMNILFFYSY
jgi:hypothetical protein